MTEKVCNVGVLASGRGSNFRAIADACRDEDFPARVACFITDNPEAPALDIAKSYGIPAFTVPVTAKKGRLPQEAEEEMADICVSHNVDVIALAGFMRILKGPLLDKFENRIMNVHPALLPSFMGLHAARQALDYGVRVTGCTVHFVDRSIDGGAIILQTPVVIDDADDEDSLLNKIHPEEHKTYVRAIKLFAQGRLKLEGRRVRILSHGLQKRGQK
ncbi:MAG: phosphoribosylglycinamide formyltransferase [Candidatus Latescibacterota bacterium]|nr:MAG: phosphoribosylglycinamide formyltransferase [Candidatus Latescibacterota bacterium]